MGTQALHKATGFSLRTGLDCCEIFLTAPYFAFMGFLKIPLKLKRLLQKEQMEQSPIPFLLQTSLSLSYLLHN